MLRCEDVLGIPAATISVVRPEDNDTDNDDYDDDERNPRSRSAEKSKTARSGAKASKPVTRFVFASKEEAALDSEMRKYERRIDAKRSELVELGPFYDSREETCYAYSEYLALLKEYCKVQESAKGGLLNKEDGTGDLRPSWRKFTWSGVSSRSFRYELLCATFNYACYDLVNYKTWFETDFAVSAAFDLASLKNRIESKYVLPSETTPGISAVWTTSSSRYPRNPDPDFATSSKTYELLKTKAREVRSTAEAFVWAIENGFPPSRTWSSDPEFIITKKNCEILRDHCYAYNAFILHVITEKTRLVISEMRPETLKRFDNSADYYASSYLLCHYYGIVKLSGVLDFFKRTLSSGETVDSRRRQTAMKFVVKLALYYARYVYDKQGETKMEVGTVKALLECYAALKTSISATGTKLGSGILLSCSSSALRGHVDYCLAALQKHNDAVSRESVNIAFTLYDLVTTAVPQEIERLSREHGLRVEVSPPVFKKPCEVKTKEENSVSDSDSKTTLDEVADPADALLERSVALYYARKALESEIDLEMVKRNAKEYGTAIFDAKDLKRVASLAFKTRKA
jgi:hypothetical protein